MRVLLIAVAAVVGHFVVQFVRSTADRVLAGAGDPSRTAKDTVARRYPKFATVTSLIVSALNFFQGQRVFVPNRNIVLVSRFLRLRFKVWPGQGGLVETVFRQRVLAAMKELDPEYQDWMVSVTYRVQ